jgi:hypothetical protein
LEEQNRMVKTKNFDTLQKGAEDKKNTLVWNDRQNQNLRGEGRQC